MQEMCDLYDAILCTRSLRPKLLNCRPAHTVINLGRIVDAWVHRRVLRRHLAEFRAGSGARDFYFRRSDDLPGYLRREMQTRLGRYFELVADQV